MFSMPVIAEQKEKGEVSPTSFLTEVRMLITKQSTIRTLCPCWKESALAYSDGLRRKGKWRQFGICMEWSWAVHCSQWEENIGRPLFQTQAPGIILVRHQHQLFQSHHPMSFCCDFENPRAMSRMPWAVPLPVYWNQPLFSQSPCFYKMHVIQYVMFSGRGIWRKTPYHSSY